MSYFLFFVVDVITLLVGKTLVFFSDKFREAMQRAILLLLLAWLKIACEFLMFL